MTLLGEARASLDEQRELAEQMALALAHVAESGTWTDFAGVQELHRRARQLLDEGVVARLAALERVRAAIAGLADLGPVSELVDQAPAHAAEAAGLSRVLLSRVEDGALIAEALHLDGDPDGAAATLARLRAGARPARVPDGGGRAAAPPPAAARARTPTATRAGATRSATRSRGATTSPRRSCSRAASRACCTATAGAAACP